MSCIGSPSRARETWRAVARDCGARICRRRRTEVQQIGDLIRRSARQYGATDCLIEGERRVSFAEFDALTDRLGNALLARGLAPGDRVAVLMPNGIDGVVVYYALAKAGLVRVPLNVR